MIEHKEAMERPDKVDLNENKDKPEILAHFQTPIPLNQTRSIAQDIGGITEHLFSLLGLKQKSFIDKKLLVHLVRGAAFAERRQSKQMARLVDLVLEMSLSVGGKGHKALRDALQSVLRAAATQEEKDDTETTRRKLLG